MMKIEISGVHMSVGDSLSEHIKDLLSRKVYKYFKEAVSAGVIITKERHNFHTDIKVNDWSASSVVIHSEYNDPDPYHSVDCAIARIEKQLRRHKEKLLTLQQKNRKAFKKVAAQKYIIAHHDLSDVGDVDAQDAKHHEDEKLIIQETLPSDVLELSVREAVMYMDFLNTNAMLFINTRSKKLNMVYYKKDGNVAWVETEIQD